MDECPSLGAPQPAIPELFPSSDANSLTGPWLNHTRKNMSRMFKSWVKPRKTNTCKLIYHFW